MGNVYDDVMTKCPYYVAGAQYSIRCEGLIADTELLTKFKDVPGKREFQKAYCFNYPNNCPLATKHDNRLKQE